MTGVGNRRRPAISLTALLLIAGLLGADRHAHAQSVTAPALKAAFLFNFAKFTEWPVEALAAGSPLTLCVFGDEEVSAALSDIVKGRPSDSAAMSVRRMTDERSLRACHVLYVSHVDLSRALGVLDVIKGLPVLTVSDVEGFAESGGIVAFFEENGKMRFAINTRASDRVRVRLSSRLLSLARIVRDEGHVVQR